MIPLKLVYCFCLITLSIHTQCARCDWRYYNNFFILLYNVYNGLSATDNSDGYTETPAYLSSEDKINKITDIVKLIEKKHKVTSCVNTYKVNDPDALRKKTPMVSIEGENEEQSTFKTASWKEALAGLREPDSKGRVIRILLNAIIHPTESGQPPLITKSKLFCFDCKAQWNWSSTLLNSLYPSINKYQYPDTSLIKTTEDQASAVGPSVFIPINNESSPSLKKVMFDIFTTTKSTLDQTPNHNSYPGVSLELYKDSPNATELHLTMSRANKISHLRFTLDSNEDDRKFKVLKLKAETAMKTIQQKSANVATGEPADGDDELQGSRFPSKPS